jgi:hypothetical protein
MITDEDLRTMMADHAAHAGQPRLSPDAVRRRARRLRHGQRLRRAGAVAVLVPAVGLGAVTVQASLATPPIVDSPVVFGASPADQLPDGRLPLPVKGQYAWADPVGLCWGEFSKDGRACAPIQHDSTGPDTVVWHPDTGLAVSVTEAPVVRAEFYSGTRVAPAQAVSFARYPKFRLISANPAWPADVGQVGLGVRGWNAAGNLVLDLEPDPSQ